MNTLTGLKSVFDKYEVGKKDETDEKRDLKWLCGSKHNISEVRDYFRKLAKGMTQDEDDLLKEEE
jgi:hypothetical protein